MDRSYRCASDDNVQQLSSVFEAVHLAARKTESKVVFYCNHETDMTQTVPALDIVGRQAITVFHIIFIEDVAHDFRQTYGSFFSEHTWFFPWFSALDTKQRLIDSKRFPV
jgi:hypothetical protein